jgi:hypothetical protein
MDRCTGTIIWHDVDAVPGRWNASAVLECSDCDYLVCSGNFHDERHSQCPLLHAPP